MGALRDFLAQISQQKRYRPFERSLPFCLGLSLNLLCVLIGMLYCYVCFIILQYSIFNLIIMGVFITVFIRLIHFMTKSLFRYEFKYTTRDLKRLTTETQRQSFDKVNAELLWSDEGRTIELILPDSEDAAAALGTTPFA
jgi:hypothetical protein